MRERQAFGARAGVRLYHRTLAAVCFLAVLSLNLGCRPSRVERRFHPADLQTLQQLETLDLKSPFLKAHLKDGSVIVFSEWRVREEFGEVWGFAEEYNEERTRVGQGRKMIRIKEVALFETNVLSHSAAIVPLALLTGITIAVTVYCMTNKKACFGSCPTFYVATESGPKLSAEGFSSSVAPSLEATDVDAIGTLETVSSSLSITMKNEALETHVVRRVELLAFRTEPGERVVALSDGRFVRVSGLQHPDAAWDDQRLWTEEFKWKDEYWRSVAADSTDLGTREDIYLHFDQPSETGQVLSISGRQSLMTTFLFYQSLAWMGRSAGEWFARLENLDPAMSDIANGVGKALGKIEVYEEHTNGDWTYVGLCGETGPLATDTWGLVLPDSTAILRTGQFRLRATQGLWRIDQVSLGKVVEEVEPLRLQPTEVWSEGESDAAARDRLNDPATALVSLPGDSFDFVFSDPMLIDDHYEVFVESQGYYWEWMRQEWMGEEDPDRVRQVLFNPRQTLVDLASDYKLVEADMERVFWGSRYVRP